MLQDTSSEIELLRASLKGDTTAFEVIVKKYQSLLCAMTFSATTNMEKSEELAHQAFISAWANLAQLKDLTKFRAWLCSIARSSIRNCLRHEQRDIVGRATSISDMGDISSESDGPIEAIINKEQQAVITQALEQIPEKYREALVLYYREQKSLKQVAQLLELSDEAARTRVSRGRKLLKERVAAMVETTIRQTGPGKAFTTAVIASVAAMAIKGSGIATAAGVATAASATGTTAVIKTIMSGLTGKIIAAAVVAAVGLGAIVLYRQVVSPAGGPELPETVDSMPRQQPMPLEERSDKAAVAQEAEAPQEESVADADEIGSGQVSQSNLGPTSREPVKAQGAEYPFQPRGVLSGLITDIETGKPVTDATVQISMGRIHETRTDSNGFYYFEKIEQPGNYDIAIDSKQYIGIAVGQRQPVVSLTQDKQIVKHFQLSRACQIDLRVVDANGVGIKGAKIVATSLADERSKVVSYMGTIRETDENGRLLFGGFPPSETDYLITVWHEVVTTVRRPDGRLWGESDYDYAQARHTVKLTDPNIIEQAEIVLTKGIAVKGYAEYSDGVPADDLEIVARPSWWHCNYTIHGYKIEADGIFTLKHIAPGSYDICAYFPRDKFGGGGTTKTVMQAQLPLANDELLVVRIPEQSPTSLASISGTIVYAGEKKPRYVDVGAYSPTAGNAHASVGYGSDGKVQESFVLGRLKPGKYRLTFSGENIEQKIIENVEAPAEGIEVELLYSAKPKLEGTVVDSETGKPVERFKVRAKKLQGLRGSGYVQEDQWAHFVDEQGRFGVEVVGPGIYQLQVAADGYAPSWSGQISTDEPAPVVVRLAPGGTIKGKVVNAEGQAISGAKVIPLSKAGGNTYQTQDMFCSEEGAVETVGGEFTLKNLPAGPETLKAVHPDYTFSVEQNIVVVEGQTTDGVEIVLSKGAVVEGYVYDGDGKPDAGVTLYFQDAGAYGGSDGREESRLGTAITDSNGFYHVPRLPEKMCYVMRKDGWQHLGVVRRTVMPKNGQTVELDFGGSPVLTGAMVIDGLPLADTRV
ncbi:MAG TPA: sigma-70 family RNA polymerase sigma factor, partial [Sedimentisphaerales bacterium]|nr:sigma-70 family RNA polymerase sigma factor [Sedimentisphaerales bacterium]